MLRVSQQQWASGRALGPNPGALTIDCLVRRVSDGHDLVEGFSGADHAEISARAFFSRLGTILQVHNFGIERLIPLPQLLILRPLLGDGGTQIARLAKALRRKPQLTLQH